MIKSGAVYLGIDFGTSGARAILVERTDNAQPVMLAQVSRRFDPGVVDLPQLWQITLFALLEDLPTEMRQRVRSLALNGTSSTVLLCDDRGHPLSEPLLYNDDRGKVVLEEVRAIAPPGHTVVSATSSLAKLLWLSRPFAHSPTRPLFLHQADWLAGWLHGQWGVSDYHNALKLGYDVQALRYPDWLLQLQLPFRLPEVVEPGQAIAPVTAEIAGRFEFSPDCQVCAGTTDSIAAFLASGARLPGEAVTSLGSTLVLKLLSEKRVEDARYGIYSHRLGDLWLVGGASNTGGAVLRQFFSDAELVALSQQINPDQESGLDYYPLLKAGERFPINDPQLPPRLEPRPQSSVQFLHGLLESMARIEALGYQRLMELGATPLTRVYTAGGGANNEVWMRMRDRCFARASQHQGSFHITQNSSFSVTRSQQTEAAYGSAILAMSGDQNSNQELF